MEFNPNPILDFSDIYPTQAVVTANNEYLAEEPNEWCKSLG
jgi:hypothetical protein